MRQPESSCDLQRAFSLAEQELGSFCAAVTIVLGADHVQQAIHFWIEELESASWAPGDEHLRFPRVIVAAIGRLVADPV